MKNIKKSIGLLMMITFLISCVGIGLDTITVQTEVPKSLVASFDAGLFRRPAPNITLDVTEVTRVGSNNTNMASGNTIRKSTVSGVPEVSGTYAAQALAGETAYWPVVIFTSNAAVNITGISFTNVTGISTSLTGSLSNTTYAKWEITGGTATAGTTIKATITYTYTWYNSYTGVNVTDNYTIDGYSYVENIIFPATEWVFQARYQGGSGNAADVTYVQRLLGKGVYGDPISLNVTSGEYLSGYFDVSTNLWVNDNDGTIPKRVGLKADPVRQDGGGGGSYANGTGAYPGDTHRIKTSVYLDISIQTLQKNNFRSHNYLFQAIRCSSGWQHYDAFRVKDGNVAYSNPGDQGDGAFGSISNDAGAVTALNPSGGTSSSTNLNSAGIQVTTTFFGNGGGASVGSNEYTLLTKWKAKGKKNIFWDSDPYLCVYKGITIGITRFDKATLRSYLNSAIGTSTANTITGSQNVTTIATANGADPDNPGTITTFKGKNPQNWYYSSGWSDYSTAYENAWAQIVKPNTNQTAIDSAAGDSNSGLYKAVRGLTLARANYTSLEELVAQVDSHDTGNLIEWPDTAYYTTASANALTEAYNAAIAARTASTTGYNVLYQPYVDYLTKTLQDAINGLTYATYNLTFDANGGTGGTSTTLYYLDPVTVPTVTREGYDFAGWEEGTPPATMPDHDITFTAQWQAYSYTVVFDGNGADGGSTAGMAFEVGETKALTANGFSKTGSIFAGWATTPGGGVSYTNTQSVSNLTAVNGATVTLYAVWSQNDYAYYFLANGGDGGTSGTLHYGDPVVVPTVTRTGYTFGGWAEGPPPATMPPNPITFTAVWFVHAYTVTYNGNGAEGGSTANSAHTYDIPKALTNNGFTKTGFSFAGWSTTPGGAVEYTNGESVTNLTGESNGVVTLYAQWSANDYSYTFSANGGEGGTSGTLHYGDPVPVPTVTREGYTFAGWGEGVPPLTMPPEPISYSAVWTRNFYTVTYDGNGSTGGSTADSSHRYDTAKVITTNGYTRMGGVFLGWSTTPDGTVQFTNGQSVLNLTAEPHGVVTLYAVWYLIDYDYTFDANGGTGSTSGTLHYGETVVVPTVTRTGYTFTGWAEGTPPAAMPDYAITYTAQWSINSYNITFDANGGTGGTGPDLMVYNSALTSPMVEKTGYTLAGWTPGVPANVPAGDATYTAQWNPNSYQVTFNANGGTGGTSDSLYYEDPLTAPTVERTGYTFAGWSPEVPATVPLNGGTYTAQWTANNYTVSYNANGGTGSMLDSDHTYDVPKALTMNGFARTGYTFSGWAVSPGGTAAYTNGQTVSNLTPLDRATVTLYAKWTANSYTVTYSGSGGTGTTADSMHIYDTASALTLNGFTKTGHSFMGWAAMENGALAYSDGETVLNLASDLNEIITFYAVWQLNEYNISFNANGGSAVDTITQFYGTAVTPPDNPARTGYTFVSWLPAVPATMPAVDTECVAQWSVNSYSVSFDSAGGSAVEPITQDYGTAVTAPADPVKAGYTFAGWLPAVPETMPAEDTVCVAKWTINQYTITFDTAGGSAVGSITQEYDTAVYAPADPEKAGYTFAGWLPAVPDTMPAEDTVCVAQWTANSYTITFDANGGTGGTAELMEFGAELNAPPVERTGYTLTGWMPEVPATVPADDAQYTAQWTANTYTIIYDGNGATGGSTASSLHTYDVPQALTLNGFIKTGYTFAGWKLSAGKAPAGYSDGEIVTNLTDTDGATITLYADWTVNAYTITFDSDGGSAVGSITQDYDTEVFAPADPEREGYTFAGWSPAVPSFMPAEDTLCVAQWTVRQFTVSFDSAGGSAVADITQNYGTAVTPPDAPVKPGYTFAGWTPAVPAVMPAEDTLCIAQWTVNDYTVTFDAQGGSVTPESIGVTYGETYGELPVPVKEGNNFGGWFTGIDGTGTQITSATTVTITENQTLYANWSIGNYSITFDTNGGTGGTGPLSMVFGDTLTAPTVTREGYVFAGWQPAVPATVPGADTVFTAQWIMTSVTVTKTESGMNINIYGWTANSQYQIWSYQQVTSDALLAGTAEVQANQWILAMAYAAGSAGAVQPDGSVLFTIPDFVSPTPNYTIAVRVLDAGGNFVQELRDSYTPEEVQEAVITKVLVDSAVTTGYELREITGGAETLIKVIGNSVDNLVYTATQIAGPTAVELTVSNTNEFLWDISALDPGIYTIKLTATNGTTTATQNITFELFSLDTNIDYGSIDDMTLAYDAGVVDITPTFNNGTFSYRLREPNRAPIYRSVEYSNPGTYQYAISAPGVYVISGYVTRAGLIGTEGSFDDGLVRTLVIPREGGGSASMTFTANQTLPNVAKGTAITFAAQATGLPDTVEYSFWRYDATGYVLVKDWSTSNTLYWTPARVGEYSFEVRAKGAGAGSYELKKTLVVNITDTVQETAVVTSITLNDAYLNANAQGKKPIMLQASAVSANGNDLLYKFMVYDDDMRGGTLQKYSVNQNCVWTPREAGTFTISVLVKNSDSFGRYDAMASFEIVAD